MLSWIEMTASTIPSIPQILYGIIADYAMLHSRDGSRVISPKQAGGLVATVLNEVKRRNLAPSGREEEIAKMFVTDTLHEWYNGDISTGFQLDE